MSPDQNLIDRREAVRRVGMMLGGVALVGGGSLLTACEKQERPAPKAGEGVGQFTAQEVAFLDEVADTILPTTKTPGAKAAKTGAFMALMVTDSYDAREQQTFRDGMRKIDEASRAANNAPFVSASPQQRLALLERLDREQKQYTDAREAARKAGAAQTATAKSTGAAAKGPRGDTTGNKPPEAKKGDKYLSDQRQENVPSGEVSGAAAITADAPAHYFRMMKELTLLGYFTSEIGYTQAMRYVESPGRYDPCVPYQPGERAWASHA